MFHLSSEHVANVLSECFKGRSDVAAGDPRTVAAKVPARRRIHLRGEAEGARARFGWCGSHVSVQNGVQAWMSGRARLPESKRSFNFYALSKKKS